VSEDGCGGKEVGGGEADEAGEDGSTADLRENKPDDDPGLEPEVDFDLGGLRLGLCARSSGGVDGSRSSRRD
jgi:hypothetical protein